jgi:hypothetical protein
MPKPAFFFFCRDITRLFCPCGDRSLAGFPFIIRPQIERSAARMMKFQAMPDFEAFSAAAGLRCTCSIAVIARSATGSARGLF